MKNSIILAIFILFISIGWFVSGQIGKVNAQDEQASINNDKTSDVNQSEETIQEINSIKIETKVLISEKIDQSILIQGQTIYNKKVDVKSETTGNITKLNFNRGDNIKIGSPLIEISKENRIEILNSAKELIKLYEIEYSSAKQLLDKGLSSKSKLALASYNLIDAKSKLKNIQLDIDNTNIMAPFSGIITNKYVEVSEFITPGTVLLTIVNLNPIKIQGYLSEYDINKVKTNTKAIIENTNGTRKEGKITFISPSAEIGTRTFEITIEADNSDLEYKSGVTTSITIQGSELEAHKISPSILTLQDDGTVGVKTLSKKNTVVFYPIQKVKDTVDGMWVSGLPEEVNIIISGQEYVTVGQLIEIE